MTRLKRFTLKLIDGYGKIGKAQEILKLYYEMEHKGLILGPVVFTSLIRNLCECEKLKEAEKFLTVIELKSVTLNEYIFDTMIKGCCRKGDVKRALYFYDEMIRKKLEPCAHTFMILVRSNLGVNTMELKPELLKNPLRADIGEDELHSDNFLD